MPAYIKYTAYFNKKANASKFKERDFVIVLQTEANHQGSKIPCTDFRRIGPYNDQRALPHNNYVVRKIGTDKMQVLHRLQLRPFAPRDPILYVQTKPQECKSDTEVMIKHGDFYARAWESNSEKTIFDNDQTEPDLTNSPEVRVQCDDTNAETPNTPGTTREGSSEILL